MANRARRKLTAADREERRRRDRERLGQRVLGVVRTDVPAHGRGRRYIIERGLTCMDELRAIVADYLDQAAR